LRHLPQENFGAITVQLGAFAYQRPVIFQARSYHRREVGIVAGRFHLDECDRQMRTLLTRCARNSRRENFMIGKLECFRARVLECARKNFLLSISEATSIAR
jgi:hypothetical protein